MPPRRRLTPSQRRDELLDAGEHLFRTREFEDVSMDDIAAQAGVTRALLYHYFSTKAGFFGAVWERAHAQLRTGVPAAAPVTVRAGLELALVAHLDFYAANLPLVLIANRSSISNDPAVRAPIDRNFSLMSGMVLDATGVTGHARDLAAAAFAGWIAFVRESTRAALLDGRITRTENLELCLAALDATVGVHADLTQPPRPG